MSLELIYKTILQKNKSQYKIKNLVMKKVCLLQNKMITSVLSILVDLELCGITKFAFMSRLEAASVSGKLIR